MQKTKKESGITLVGLVITIIVLAIITTVVIQYSKNGIEYSNQKRILADLEAVQHAVYENYEQYKITGDITFFVGTKVEEDKMPELEQNSWEKTNPTADEDIYYRLTKEDLKEIGIDNAKDEYIVNYKTGECFNVTKKTIDVNGKQHELYIK